MKRTIKNFLALRLRSVPTLSKIEGLANVGKDLRRVKVSGLRKPSRNEK